MKSQEKVYIFLYSHLLDRFDTELILNEKHLRNLQLRARLNTHKNLRLYGVKLTAQQVLKINNQISSVEIVHTDLFDNLPSLNIGYEL